MIDRKDLLTALVGGLIGAIGTAALYTVSRTAETTAFDEALARAQERLEEIAQKATAADTQAKQVSTRADAVEKDAEKIAKARQTVEADQATVRTVRESLGSTRGDEIARGLLADDTMRQQLVVAVSRAAAPLKVAVEDCHVQFGLSNDGHLLLRPRTADEDRANTGFAEYRLKGNYPNVRAAWLAPYDDIGRFADLLGEYHYKAENGVVTFSARGGLHRVQGEGDKRLKAYAIVFYE